MAALTAAFELSEGDWHERFERITLYQRGWRLGGKGASSRGPNGRIEEHGLHLLLGYYDQTFEVMRRCYDELDRGANDPSCPIRSWDEAVRPANRVAVTELDGERWVPWVASFTPTPGRPGTDRAFPVTPADVFNRSLQLLADFFRSVAPPPSEGRAERVHLSASPLRHAPSSARLSDADLVLRGAATLGLVLPLSFIRRFGEWGRSVDGQADSGLVGALTELQTALRRVIASNPTMRRTLQLVELVTANVVGILSDGLLAGPDGFTSIDHLDYRDWLVHHGIEREALHSPLLRGMYDLTFAYEDGDPGKPRFSAGLGLQLATQMLLGYSGGLFWKMQAGMGEIVFAPLYQVLQRRGVEFNFFHRVDALRVSADGRSIAEIELGLQAETIQGPGGYHPLTEVKGLPCWPAEPLGDQLVAPDKIDGVNLECFWSPRDDRGRNILRAGREFDEVVFGISVGMVPYICGELLERSSSWREMAGNLGTVATQSFQLWLSRDERELGWPGDPGDVVSGFTEPFDTWASMSHLIPVEDWPDGAQPRSIAYFCSALGQGVTADATSAHGEVLGAAREFLDREIKALWPNAVGARGFRWELLCTTGDDGPCGDNPVDGPSRLETQYWKANVDPSDMYVQSLPGTGRFRIAPGSTGFSNLTVAGDWTDCGLNAGCLEAAARSGQLAAAAILERNRRT